MKTQTIGAHYESPKIEQIEINVEKGFATSADVQVNDCGFRNSPWNDQNWGE